MDARLIQFHITPKLEGQTQEELRQNPSGFNMEFIAANCQTKCNGLSKNTSYGVS
ncbi:hypothetical protein [Limosilactobacillus fermentum]|uniref:hypothetical protein n=1 Tax=Limosilactobacillus fermentum TaxID=1613 RepID=UPI003557D415